MGYSPKGHKELDMTEHTHTAWYDKRLFWNIPKDIQKMLLVLMDYYRGSDLILSPALVFTQHERRSGFISEAHLRGACAPLMSSA